jgi:hypothetical protein
MSDRIVRYIGKQHPSLAGMEGYVRVEGHGAWRGLVLVQWAPFRESDHTYVAPGELRTLTAFSAPFARRHGIDRAAGAAAPRSA